jgi:hypothetical protein
LAADHKQAMVNAWNKFFRHDGATLFQSLVIGFCDLFWQRQINENAPAMVSIQLVISPNAIAKARDVGSA